MSNFELALRLFLQLAIILAACRLVGVIGRRLGQPQVVSEMVAGVLLGPSLLGLLAPQTQTWLFPATATLPAGAGSVTITHPSMSILFALSQLGLVLYMFLVGLEFDTGLLSGRARSTWLVSGAGIAVPFALGALAALVLHGRPEFFTAGITPRAAALYLGASMSITAFPTLARIIYEKGIAGTRLGTIALAAGSLDDAVAWCLLATVLASLKGSPAIALMAIGGGILYVLLMATAGRRALRVLERWTRRDDGVTPATLLVTLLVLMLAAWYTDVIGVYAVFGAFVAGAVMPRGRFAAGVRGHLEVLTTTFLLPIFFVYSGLNTQLGLVRTAPLLLVAGVVILLAVAGKGLACMLAARVSGESWREAATIGTLMNTRGLMELIILNIGLNEGVITPTLFTIMVMMAVVTTLMASPLFDLVHGINPARPAAVTARGAAAATIER